MLRRVTLILSIAILLGAGQAFAQDDFAVGAKVSTLGLGVDGVAKVNDSLNVRLGIQCFEYDKDGTESGINYDFDLGLFTVGTIADYFPFENGFRLSLGAFYNGNELDMKATAANSYEIGNTTYTPAEVGSLNGKIDFNELAPYVGIGWGNPFGKDSNWSFSCDLGIMYQGSPDVSLSADGTLANNAAFRSDIEREVASLESDIDEYEYYPVISVAFTYKF